MGGIAGVSKTQANRQIVLGLLKGLTRRSRALCVTALLTGLAVAASGVFQAGSAQSRNGKFYNPRTSVYVSAHEYWLEMGGIVRLFCGGMLIFAAIQVALVLGRLKDGPVEDQYR